MQHLTRAWSRHWTLQLASVTVMTLVLVILNFLFFGFSAFNSAVSEWGHGLEMIVYLKDEASTENVVNLQGRLQKSSDFSSVEFVSKPTATQKFLSTLGPASMELLKDPQWNSPLPASFELRIDESTPPEARLKKMQTWSAELKGLDWVEDVFYGQGWVENFTQFVVSARGVVVGLWILSLSVGLLIISNCIRLSFLQRKEEIEVLELVGATTSFIRMPFLIEGLFLGFLSSVFSLLLSFGFHSLLLNAFEGSATLWLSGPLPPALPAWGIVLNILTAIVFGLVGAWTCVRGMNNGWAAVSS